MPLLAVTPRRPLHWVDLTCGFCHYSLIVPFHRGLSVSTSTSSSVPFTFSANGLFSSFIQALLDLLPEILAALEHLRLCSHPLELLVMTVASLFRIFHPLGFLPLISTICLFKYCPCRMLPVPNSGQHFLTTTRCYNTPSRQSNFL